MLFRERSSWNVMHLLPKILLPEMLCPDQWPLKSERAGKIHQDWNTFYNQNNLNFWFHILIFSISQTSINNYTIHQHTLLWNKLNTLESKFCIFCSGVVVLWKTMSIFSYTILTHKSYNNDCLVSQKQLWSLLVLTWHENPSPSCQQYTTTWVESPLTTKDRYAVTITKWDRWKGFHSPLKTQ